MPDSETAQGTLNGLISMIRDLIDRVGKLEDKGQAGMPEPAPVEDPPDFDDGIFSDTLSEIGVILNVLEIVQARLAVKKNVIRPSLALELVADVIEELIVCDVPEFADHSGAWREVESVLRQAAVTLLWGDPAGDNSKAQQLSPIGTDLNEVLYAISTELRRFRGLYQGYMANTVGSSFGRLTPGEIAHGLWYVASLWAPKPPVAGRFSMPHPQVKGWFAPQPWAETVREALKQIADELADEPTEPVPPLEPPPYSVGGRF